MSKYDNRGREEHERLDDNAKPVILPISNEYGALQIGIKGGETVWCVEDCRGLFWDSCPQYLYDALMRYSKEQETK